MCDWYETFSLSGPFLFYIFTQLNMCDVSTLMCVLEEIEYKAISTLF